MKHLFTAAFILCCLSSAIAQNVGIGTTNPASCAALDVTSATKGFLPPRMSWTQIQAIPLPTPGLTVFDVGINALRVYTSKGWTVLSPRSQGIFDPPGNFSTGTTTVGTGVVIPLAVKVSRLNNSYEYVAGIFSGFTILGGSVLSTTATYSTFFGKFDSTGASVWIKVIGNNNDVEVNSMDIDAYDNLYFGGTYGGTVDFDPGAGVTNLTALGSSFDAFYARYDASGNFKWAKSIGGSAGTDIVNSISVGGTYVNVCGTFVGSAFFNGNTLSGGGGFAAHYDTSTGNLSGQGWVKQISCPLLEMRCIKQAGSNIIVSGDFSGTCTFPGGLTKTTAAAQTAFLAPLDITGNATTVLLIDPVSSTGVTEVDAITTDASNNIYIGGRFSDGTDFDPGAGTAILPVSASGGGGFVEKLNSNNTIAWVRSIVPASAGAAITEVQGIVTDGTTVTVSGEAGGPILLSNGNIQPTNGQDDVMTARYNASTGALLWLATAGSAGGDFSNGIDQSSNGRKVWTVNQIYGSPFIGYDGTKISASGFYLSRYEE